MRSVAFVASALVSAMGLALIAAAPAGTEKQTVTFQNGVGGYTGTVDTEIWALAPNTIIDTNPNVTTDANNDGGESQILMRFDGVVGDKPGQVPPKASVHSAKLVISAFDQGNTVHLHRMLVPWPKTATWNSVVGGVTADGQEASRHRDSFTFGKIAANSSAVPFEVTDTVQAWANGDPNHGWVFINTGGDGWDFYSSEFDDVKQRPKLTVEFTPPKGR
jgi:hypothetical protein